MKNSSVEFNIVIPARYASSRLPGKPLKVINGKTMITRVCQNAIESGAHFVIVATDDERILNEVKENGFTAIMTSPDHLCGTDRINEVASKLKWSDDTIIVNLQGDEPGIGPGLLHLVAQTLSENTDASISTLATTISNSKDLFDPNIVKVVTDNNNKALYFSRSPIPFVRDNFDLQKTNNNTLPPNIPFLRHLGLYAYRTSALKEISKHPPTPLEKAESLEQLRPMCMGQKIAVAITDCSYIHGVDTEEDLKRASQFLSR